MAISPIDNLDKWTRDWKRLKHQKHRSRGGVEASMLLDYLLYEGEHQSIQVQNQVLTRSFRHQRDKNKLRLMIPLARRLADRKIGRHWSIAHKFRATPNVKTPIAYDRADIVGDQLIPALDFKLQQDTLRWQLYKWQVVCGVVVEHVDWKEGVSQDVMPKYSETGEMLWKDALTGAEITEQEVELLVTRGNVVMERFMPATEVQTVGDVGGDIYDPFRVFVDASVTQLKFLGPDQRVYLADIRSMEWIRETFGSDATANLEPTEDLTIMGTQLMDRGVPISGLNMKDLLPQVQGSHGKDDPEMCIVLTMYQPGSSQTPGGIRAFFVPGQGIIDADECPYSDQVPVVDWHWAAPGGSFWTNGFMRDLQALSKFVDKRFSQLGEAANAQVYEMLALGGDLTSKDIPTDFPGVIQGGINEETGALLVQPVPRGNLPAFFPDTIRLSMETLDAIGGSDLMSQRKMPGQMRGSLAIPMIQEILDSEDGPRFAHIAEQFAREKMMRVNRIKEMYPPIRTLQYTGEDLRNEVLEFHADDILRAGIDFTVTVDPGSIMPELSSMREARVRERMQWAPGLYTSDRTGTIDWSKVAKELRYNDRHGEQSTNRARKLARQVMQWVRQGRITVQDQPPDPATGKQAAPKLILDESRPFVVMPFWNHNAMMDEYQDYMETTEFIEASGALVRIMQTLYEHHRMILSQMDQARQQSVENKMVQSAMAQAAAQSAAMAATAATQVAVDQVMIQQEQNGPGFENLQGIVRQLIGEAQSAGQQAGAPQRRQMPTGPTGRKRLPPSANPPMI